MVVQRGSGYEVLLVIVLRRVGVVSKDLFAVLEVLRCSECKENDLPIEKKKLSRSISRK